MNQKTMLSKTLRKKYLRCRSVQGSIRPEEPSYIDDAGRYKNLAIELSVNAASIITMDDILVDPRVRMKCQVPPCRHYGTSLNCPPHTKNFVDYPQALSRYRIGLLLRWDFPRETVLNMPPKNRRSIYTTIAAIESAAFYDGYYFACGFAAGSCRNSLCNNIDCQALTRPEKGCLHPLLARPSMEAMGLDVFGMAHKIGWSIYPAGQNCPDDIELLSRIGLILIT